MAFVKFEMEAPKRPVATIRNGTISLSAEPLSGTPAVTSDNVFLLWDDDRSLIGLQSASDPKDKSSFRLRKTRNGYSIRATRFFDRFKLGNLAVAPDATIGHEQNGSIVTIPISVPKRSFSSIVSNGSAPTRRRGRRPKSLEAAVAH